MMGAEKTVCSMCGNMIRVLDGGQTEDYLKIEKKWGYFSERDGITHSFCICEKCYNNWIASFQLPVSEQETTELL